MEMWTVSIGSQPAADSLRDGYARSYPGGPGEDTEGDDDQFHVLSRGQGFPPVVYIRVGVYAN